MFHYISSSKSVPLKVRTQSSFSHRHPPYYYIYRYLPFECLVCGPLSERERFLYLFIQAFLFEYRSAVYPEGSVRDFLQNFPSVFIESMGQTRFPSPHSRLTTGKYEQQAESGHARKNLCLVSFPRLVGLNIDRLY